MHGDRTQRQRYEAVQQFTSGKCPILVATSVAARGLDFPLIGYVVNYDLPDTSDFYIHRIGRTGRAGHLGKSISFFDPDRESDRNIAPDLVQKLSEVRICICIYPHTPSLLVLGRSRSPRLSQKIRRWW